MKKAALYILFILLLAGVLLPSFPVVRAWALPSRTSSVSNSRDCPDLGPLLRRPFSQEANGYARSMVAAFAKNEPRQSCFSKKFLQALLAERSTIEPSSYLIDWEEIAKLIVVSGSEELVSEYLRFWLRTRQASDEQRALGLAVLYNEQAPVFLRELTKLKAFERDQVIRGVSGGLVRHLYPFLSSANLSRKILGVHYELRQSKGSPYRAWILLIEEQVSGLLARNS